MRESWACWESHQTEGRRGREEVGGSSLDWEPRDQGVLRAPKSAGSQWGPKSPRKGSCFTSLQGLPGSVTSWEPPLGVWPWHRCQEGIKVQQLGLPGGWRSVGQVLGPWLGWLDTGGVAYSECAASVSASFLPTPISLPSRHKMQQKQSRAGDRRLDPSPAPCLLTPCVTLDKYPL